jgi:hypothetical protein
MAIVPAKQIAPFTEKTASFTTSLLDLSNYTNRTYYTVLTLVNTKRAFIRNIRLARTPSSFNTGTYGNYDGSQGYSLNVKVCDFIGLNSDYSNSNPKDQLTISTYTPYVASVSGIVLDFNMDIWYSNQAIGVANIYLPVVITDNTYIANNSHGSTVKYDVVVYYDSVNAV